GVLLRHHERVDLVADRHLVGRVHRAADRELGNRDDPFRLVTDIDEHLVLVHAHYGAVNHLSLVDRGEGRLIVGDQLAVWACGPDAVAGDRLLSVGSHTAADQYSHGLRAPFRAPEGRGLALQAGREQFQL